MAEENKAQTMFSTIRNSVQFNDSASISSNLNQMSSDINAIKKAIVGNLKSSGNNLIYDIRNGLNKINKSISLPTKILKESLGKINDTFTNGINGIKGSISPSINRIKQTIMSPFNKLSESFQGLKNMFTNPFKKLGNVFSNLREKFKKAKEERNQNMMYKSIFLMQKDIRKLVKMQTEILNIEKSKIDRNRYSVKDMDKDDSETVYIEKDNKDSGFSFGALATLGTMIAGFFKSGIGTLTSALTKSITSVFSTLGPIITNALSAGMSGLTSLLSKAGIITKDIAKTAVNSGKGMLSRLLSLSGTGAGALTFSALGVGAGLMTASYLANRADEQIKAAQDEFLNIINKMTTSPNQRHNYPDWGINNKRFGDLTDEEIITLVYKGKIHNDDKPELITELISKRDELLGIYTSEEYAKRKTAAQNKGTLSDRLKDFDSQLLKPGESQFDRSSKSTKSTIGTGMSLSNGSNMSMSLPSNIETPESEVPEGVKSNISSLADYTDMEGFERSIKNIQAAHPIMQPKMIEFLLKSYEEGYNPIITQSTRGKADQERAKMSGNSNASFGRSYHNYGMAFDVAFPGKTTSEMFSDKHDWDAIGSIGKSLGLVWGGDFKSLDDKPHFQASLPIDTLASNQDQFPLYAAKGAILNGNRPVIAGEAGPEAIIPLNNQGLDFMVEALNKSINITGNEKVRTNDNIDKLKSFLLGPFVDALGDRIAKSRINIQGNKQSGATALNVFA